MIEIHIPQFNWTNARENGSVKVGSETMQAIVNLPDSLYERSEALAASRGASVEQFIVEAVASLVPALPEKWNYRLSAQRNRGRWICRISISMIFLPDVNVWIALAAERHLHHRAARLWFSSLQDGALAFCRVTQLGFLRLLTNSHVMKEEVLLPDGAWRAYRAMRSDRRAAWLFEPAGFSEDGWEAPGSLGSVP
jgi:hypothetical protein